jgi:hypothetical protein
MDLMALTLTRWISGIGHGLVMDELDAWSPHPGSAPVPAPRTAPDASIDLVEAEATEDPESV